MRLEKCQGPLSRGFEGQMRGLHFTLRTLGVLLRTFIFFHWLTLAAGWEWLGKPGSLGACIVVAEMDRKQSEVAFRKS